MDCRLFIDEVGNADLRGSATDDNIRYLSLTGLIAKKTAHATAFRANLDSFKSKFLGQGGADVILHRREIVRREGPFRVLNDPDVAARFDAALLALIDKLPFLVTTVAIDKRAHLDTYAVWHHDPYHYCLQCMIERYALWMNRHGLTGDVVIEQRFKKADKRVKESFRRTWEFGTAFVPAAVFQARLVSRDIKFESKRANVPEMQICDLLAHPSFRSMKFERLGLPEPADFGGRIAALLIAKKYARNPVTRKIDGFGRKWLP